MKYYVYAHYREKDSHNKPFYIGKGSGNRCDYEAKRSLFWNRIVKKYGYFVHIIKEGLSEYEAFDFEIKMILKYKAKGFCEANFTDGGDGVRVLKRWWGDKISAAMKGRNAQKGTESKSYKDVISKDELFELYVTKKLSTIEIGKLKNVSYATIWTRLTEYGIASRKVGSHGTKIVCINDGKEFDSILSAANHYGLHRENIRKVLKGIYKHTGKLNFKYKNYGND